MNIRETVKVSTVMFLSFQMDGLLANIVDPDQTAPRGGAV